ncbi:polyketide synthase [Colletotrichum musicola]|uniref:Polyketide synthase n=1 Tax=Colletotrichum musicola TaxID=2175873 RepID=A0A8H6KWR6_9PEZI|nr:polyketide synthase [Colletotrichum musicola]
MASPDMPIAIVGMGCRFAGNVTGPGRLWELLKSGQSGWSQIPESRFATNGILHPQKDKIGSTNVRGGYFLGTDPGAFDASFFNLSTEVASTLDPQIRMTLEVVFEAMESAGIKLPDIQGSDTSVFAGCMVRDYHDTLARDPHTLPRYFMTGNAATMAANRVSHFYDLRGPSMTIDTGCSTTLTALHLACRSLQAGESGSAIVTGANLMLNPDVFVSMSTIGFLSPDGISYSFDHRANGYGRGDGIAAVILKRLDHAVAAGDPIRAVIRGSALNQDGKTPTITTPSREAQERLMGACYRSCGLDPGETGFVEAHGTGTPTGDPIEVTAIANVIASASPPGSDPLLLGSVKSAIGHTEAASGLASVIKVVCALEAGVVPPNGNFEELNPKLRLEEWNMQVPTTVRPWPRRGATRRASINNFGFGGANAHVILEEYRPESVAGLLASCNGMASSVAVNGHSKVNGHPKVNGYPQVNEHDPEVTNGMNGESGFRGEEISTALQHTKSNGHYVGAMPAPDSADSRVFVLYGKDQASCQSRVNDLSFYLSLRDNEEHLQILHDLAYTLSERRTVMPWMAACRSGDMLGLQEALEDGKLAAARIPSQPPRLGFVFNGQGAQWYAMGRELIHRYDVFRASIEQMGVHIREMGATWSLMDELLRDEDTSNIQNFEYSLPLCSALQIALVDLLRSWSIEPSAVTGHSSGEVAAAYAAGALDARSAIAIPYLRGALSAETDQIIGRGGMIAVGASRPKVQEYIDRVRSGSIVVACINSQNSITASGDLSAVHELEDMLVRDGVFCRRLRINGAFHSHHMAPISAKYMDQLRPVLKPRHGPRDVVFSSSMTGGLLQDLDILATPEYWNNNMLRAVEFEASFRAMCVGARPGQGSAEGSPAQQIDVVVELGPHGALGGPIQDMLSLPAFEGTQISYLTGLVRKKSAVETTHSLVCELLRKGWPVDLAAVNSPGTERRARVLNDLPTYPWNHSAKFWMEPRANRTWRRQTEPSHDILGRYQSTSDPFVPTWRNVLRLSEMPWLGDHVVGSNVVFPAAGYISMVSEAAYRLAGRYLPDETVQELRLRNVEFLSALQVPDAEGQEVQLMVMRRREGLSSWASWLDFRVSSVSANNDWSLHCQGSFKLDRVSTAAEADHHHAAGPKMPPGPLTVTRRIDPADLWSALANVDIRHGPAFQKISTIESTRENSVVTFQSTDPSSPHQGSDLFHPATLDSVFQAAYTVLPGLGSSLESAFIPRAIKSMSLRRQGTIGPVFQAHIRRGRVGVQSFDTSVTVFAASPVGERNVNAVLHMDGLLYQSLDGASARSDRGSLCSTVTWAPDPSFASSMRAAVESMKRTIASSEKEAMIDLQRAVLHYVNDAVRTLTDQDVDMLAWHYKKHRRWMLQLLQRAAQNELGPESSKWLQVSADDKATLLDRVAAANVNGEMISRLGPRAVALMKGEVAPLELMVEGELLYRYYVGALKWDRSTGQVARLVRLLAHKNPRATILEIGGGTGGGTQAILDALGRGSGGDGQGALFERYDFTDISQGFFEAAQKRFEPWRDLMTFRKLDIEADPVAQGFEAGSYDIVVACQCLHATKAMDRTMSNVRRLLKPGGKLVLIETTRDALDVFMAFGFLPGWWLSEEPERVDSPSLTVPFWDQVLRRNGFSGLDVELRDCEDPDFYSFSAMVSTARTDADVPAYPQNVALVCTTDRFPASWLQALQSRMAAVLGYEPPIQDLELDSTTMATAFHFETCIYLDELLQPNLLDLDQEGFHSLKTMITHCDGLLWLTRGAAMESSLPEVSLSHGLLRTMRHEAPVTRYITLDVSAERDPCGEETIAAICEVFAAVFDAAATATSTRRDWEFCERGGVIHVPRLFSMPPLGLGPQNDAADPEMKPFLLGEKRIEADVGRGRGEGQPPILFTEEASDSDASCEMSDYHVEIRPRAFGLESRGPYPPRGGSRPVALASDEEHVTGCAGIIIRAGKLAADHGLGIGDRVCFLIAGSRWASSMRVHCAHVAKIPEHVVFSVAASLAPCYVTVHLALQDVARASSGERVLVHGPMAVMGRAAVEYGRARGLLVYLAVEDEAEKEKLGDELGLAANTLLNRSKGLIVEQIWAATGREGVDVIISPSRAFVEQSYECLRDFGRVIELDVDGGTFTNTDTLTVNNGSVHRMQLGSWLVRRPWIVSQAMQASMLLLLGHRPCVEEIPISQSARVLDDNMNPPQHGREQALLALTVGDADVVPTPQVTRRPRHAALKADASYLLVGGAGGVGRSLCEWAIARGARHLVVMSRSARSDDEFLAELAVSCNVRVVKCDVSDQDQLAAARAAFADMPPIRGIFQAAMILKDAVFEQLSLEDFHAVLRPKVLGTRALLRQFTDLDFFITFSSVLGITGAPGQANYTAAGAYQDALASHARSRGIAATTIDLSMLQSVGHVAGHRSISSHLARNGIVMLQEAEMHRILDHTLAADGRGTVTPQVVTGIGHGSSRAAFDKGWITDARFTALQKRESLARHERAAAASPEQSSSLREALPRDLGPKKLARRILEALAQELRRMFSSADVDVSRDLTAHGVDSLVAVEIRNWLAAQTGIGLSVLDLIQAPSLTDLADCVGRRIAGEQEPVV